MRENKKIYKPDDLIDILQLSRNTVYKLLRNGDIPSTKVGKSYRISASALNKWLNPESTLTTEDKGLSAKTKEKTLSKPTPSRKKNSTPGILKRGNTWTCIYYVTDPATGKRKQKWKGGFATAREAKAAQHRLQAEADAGVNHDPSKLTFHEYGKSFLTWKGNNMRPNTAANYSKVLDRYTGEIDAKPMSKITAEDIIRTYESLKDTDLSPSTIHGYMARIRTIFNFAEVQGDIIYNPFRRFSMPPLKQKRRSVPSDDEIALILKVSGGTSLYIPVLLATTLGIRCGEICGLQFNDFDFEAGTVHIQRQIAKMYNKDHKVKHGVTDLKTATSDRILTVPSITMAQVKNLQEKRDTDNPFVIQGLTHDFAIPNSISVAFAKLRDTLGLTFTFHDLRHVYSTLCQRYGVPLNVIQDALGHADMSTTTQVYIDTKPMMDLPSKAIEQAMEEILNSH